MNDWIEIKTETNIAGLIVHEVKCPFCGFRETFHTKPSSACYICSRPLSYKKEEELQLQDPTRNRLFQPKGPDDT